MIPDQTEVVMEALSIITINLIIINTFHWFTMIYSENKGVINYGSEISPVSFNARSL